MFEAISISLAFLRNFQPFKVIRVLRCIVFGVVKFHVRLVLYLHLKISACGYKFTFRKWGAWSCLSFTTFAFKFYWLNSTFRYWTQFYFSSDNFVGNEIFYIQMRKHIDSILNWCRLFSGDSWMCHITCHFADYFCVCSTA